MTQPPGGLPPVHLEQRRENVVLEGEALDAAERLQEELGVDNLTAVVYQGIALMKAAIGKQVELRDPGSRNVQTVRFWRR